MSYEIAAVIFGAAVKNDGTPSGALSRRVEAALELRQKFASVLYVPTGGLGKNKPVSEAAVMQDLLIKGGVSSNDIEIDEKSTDTMDSIVACVNILKARNIRRIIICTDTYHVLRIKLLFRIFGMQPVSYPMPSGLKANGWLRWIYYYVREAAAILWDLPIGVVRKLTL